MAVNRADRYPGRWGTETTDYPLGVPKNRTSATSQDGSYFEKDWISDYEAFFGALMTDAGLVADGTADTATDSQFYDALVATIGSNALDLTTNQSAGGIKTFTSSPIIPAPATDYQAATKLYVDSSRIGEGQTWQDVSSSRTTGVTYTNSTGKPIVVNIVFAATAAIWFSVDGVNVARPSINNDASSMTAIVPDGSTYSAGAGFTISNWSELR